MSVEEFDLDDVEVRDKASAFKVDKDTKYRVGFPLLNGNGRIKLVKVAYLAFEDSEERFHSWQISDDAELNKTAIAMGAEEKSHFVTMLLVYRCDKSGKPLTPLSWDVQPVKLADKKVKNLKEINAEWDLTSIDISLSSDNPSYQEHTYTPLKTAIWRLKDGDPTLAKVKLEASIEADVLEAANAAAETMTEVVAYKLNDAKIKSILGLAADGGAEGNGTGAGVDLDESFNDLGADDL